MKKSTMLWCVTGYSALNVQYTLQTGHGGFVSTLTFLFLIGVILYGATRTIMWVVPELMYHYKQRRLLAKPTYDHKRWGALPSTTLVVEADPRRFDPHIRAQQLERTLAIRAMQVSEKARDKPARELERV